MTEGQQVDCDQRAEHTKAEHTYGEGCGHEAIVHGDLVDYIPGGEIAFGPAHG